MKTKLVMKVMSFLQERLLPQESYVKYKHASFISPFWFIESSIKEILND